MPQCPLCGEDAQTVTYPDDVERTDCLKCSVRIPVAGLELDEGVYPNWRRDLIQAALWLKHRNGKRCIQLDSGRAAELVIFCNREFLADPAECTSLAISLLVKDTDPKGGPWGEPIRLIAEALAKSRDEAVEYVKDLLKHGRVEILDSAALRPVDDALPIRVPSCWVRLPGESH
jgi:hypothetical protein